MNNFGPTIRTKDDDDHEEDWEMTLNRYRALRAEARRARKA
jgi:hypothetical protein